MTQPDYPLTQEDKEDADLEAFIDQYTHCSIRPTTMQRRKELAKKRAALAGSSQPRQTGVNQENTSELYTVSQLVGALQPKTMGVQIRAPPPISFHPNHIIGGLSTGA